MGKVQGRQLTLPASLNQRVNLHRGHNGFSLARQLHTQAVRQRPGFLLADPLFVSDLNQRRLGFKRSAGRVQLLSTVV